MTTNNTNIEIRPFVIGYIAGVRRYLKKEHKKVKPEWEGVINTLAYNMEMEARIKEQIASDGLMIQDRYGNQNKHPLFPILNSFQVQIFKCVSELGLSPKAQKKIKEEPKVEEPKEEPNFLQQLNDSD